MPPPVGTAWGQRFGIQRPMFVVEVNHDVSVVGVVGRVMPPRAFVLLRQGCLPEAPSLEAGYAS